MANIPKLSIFINHLYFFKIHIFGHYEEKVSSRRSAFKNTIISLNTFKTIIMILFITRTLFLPTFTRLHRCNTFANTKVLLR